MGASLSNISLVLINKHGWRVTYLIGGIFGVIVGIFVLLIMREPGRGRFDPIKQNDDITAVNQIG